MKTGYAAYFTSSIREPLAVLFILFLLYIQVVIMHNNVTEIMVALVVFYKAVNSLFAIQGNWQTALENIGALEFINTELSLKVEKKESSALSESLNFNKNILLKNIDYEVAESRILNNLTIKIPKNEMISVIGPSGSGKTAITQALSGVVELKNGELIIDENIVNSKNISSWRNKIGYISQEPFLLNATLYVTLEPCAMCAGAMVHSRIKRLVYGAADLKTGAAGSVFNLVAHAQLNHQVEVQSGVYAEETGGMLSQFFKRRRKEKKQLKKLAKEQHTQRDNNSDEKN